MVRNQNRRVTSQAGAASGAYVIDHQDTDLLSSNLLRVASYTTADPLELLDIVIPSGDVCRLHHRDRTTNANDTRERAPNAIPAGAPGNKPIPGSSSRRAICITGRELCVEGGSARFSGRASCSPGGGREAGAGECSPVGHEQAVCGHTRGGVESEVAGECSLPLTSNPRRL